MKTILLDELYPYIKSKSLVLIDDQVFEILDHSRKEENALLAKIKYHRAFYSLDNNDNIESYAINKVPDPMQIILQNELNDYILMCIEQLTVVESRRISAYFYDGLSQTDIAKIEGVTVWIGYTKLDSFIEVVIEYKIRYQK